MIRRNLGKAMLFFGILVLANISVAGYAEQGPQVKFGPGPPEKAVRKEVVEIEEKAGKALVAEDEDPQAELRSGMPEEPDKKEVAQKKDQIVFNFDNADLYEVIRTVAELLDINYLVDPNVRGKVTIHTAGRLKKKDMFPVFLQLLQANGLTAVREGSLYRITEVKGAPRMPLALRSGRQGEDVPFGEKIIIQIIPLKFISAQEMSKLLTPFMSAGGVVVPGGESNTILVVDKGINILKILRLVEAFDVNLFEKVRHRFYVLENMDAEEMAKILGEVFPLYVTAHKADVKFIAITRLNALLAVSSDPQVFDKVGEFVRELDVADVEVEPRIYVYFVKNGEAEQLAGLLRDVFGNGKSEKDKTKTKVVPPPSRNPFSKEAKASAKAKKVKQAPKKKVADVTRKTIGSETAGSLRGEINITSDEIRNALIIEAVPADYRVIEDILRRIDILPRQVLIEATIAEITLDDKSELGVEWSYSKTGEGSLPGSGLLSATMGKDGLFYAIGIANRVKADISALAKEGKVNILSSPHILASDNKEARIDISDEIPVASSDWEYTSGDNPVIKTDIQYRDTGVILSVTPHINDRGLVTMDISQEVSEYSGDYEVGGKKYPSFYKRSINTTLTVRHGQTIVIGGLIKEKGSNTAQGTPCLVNIPVIRYVFGKDSREFKKTEMIVLITPRVVVNLEDVDAVTEEFKNKVKGVTERFKEYSR